jgi:ubiquitin C-terminal hydrolase
MREQRQLQGRTSALPVMDKMIGELQDEMQQAITRQSFLRTMLDQAHTDMQQVASAYTIAPSPCADPNK